MRFLIDMPLSPRRAVWLKEKGHDADHASDVGLPQTKDHHLIESARQQNRITADRDFPKLLAIRLSADPGVILFWGRSYNKRCSICSGGDSIATRKTRSTLR